MAEAEAELKSVSATMEDSAVTLSFKVVERDIELAFNNNAGYFMEEIKNVMETRSMIPAKVGLETSVNLGKKI